MKKAILLTIIGLFIVLTSPLSFAQQGPREKLNFGIILTHMAVSPTAILEGVKPFAKYLSTRINADVEVEIIPDVNQMLARLSDGSLNCGYVSNLDYVKIKQQKNVSPFAKVVKGGSSTYNAVLLVRNDSGINSLADLKGKSFAYSSTNSSHGYLYPNILIKNQYNIPLEKFFGKLITTKKDPDGILSVLYKRADAVSASSQTYAILCELMPRLKRELKVLSTSQPLVHGPMFTYDNNIKNKTVIKEITREVLNMGNATDGKQVLLLFKVGGWVPASDADYNSLRQMLGK